MAQKRSNTNIISMLSITAKFTVWPWA